MKGSSGYYDEFCESYGTMRILEELNSENGSFSLHHQLKNFLWWPLSEKLPNELEWRVVD